MEDYVNACVISVLLEKGLYLHICMYVCVCMYVRMYVCMYVCMMCMHMYDVPLVYTETSKNEYVPKNAF